MMHPGKAMNCRITYYDGSTDEKCDQAPLHGRNV